MLLDHDKALSVSYVSEKVQTWAAISLVYIYIIDLHKKKKEKKIIRY